MSESTALIADYSDEDPQQVYHRKHRKQSLRVLAVFWFFTGKACLWRGGRPSERERQRKRENWREREREKEATT